METQILAEQSNEYFDIDSRRVWELDSHGRLSSFIGYEAGRVLPRLALHMGTGSCSYGLYKWGSNCFHLLYDVLSDHFINRLHSGASEVVIPLGVSSLAAQVLSYLGDGIRIGQTQPDDAPVSDIPDEFGWVDNPWRHAGHQHPFITDAIKANLCGLCSENDASPKHIMIERRVEQGKDYSRNIHDIGRVRDQLDAAGYDFAVVDLDGRSLADQVNLFYNAETVIATHGAGLTWINFCRPHTKVIEISTPFFRSADGPRNMYWLMGQQSSLRYCLFSCEDVIGDVSNPHNHDANVSSETLLRLLNL